MARKTAAVADCVAEDTALNLDACFKVLSATQDQIRFADTKAAFLFGINTLLFGFVSGTTSLIKKGLVADHIPAVTVVSLVALIAFVVMAALAVITLILVVMSRFGDLAPNSRVFFGHIIKRYGKNYGAYVDDVSCMTELEWVEDVATQIVEVSHIALIKHQHVRWAGKFTIIGFVFWLISVFSSSLVS